MVLDLSAAGAGGVLYLQYWIISRPFKDNDKIKNSQLSSGIYVIEYRYVRKYCCTPLKFNYGGRDSNFAPLTFQIRDGGKEQMIIFPPKP